MQQCQNCQHPFNFDWPDLGRYYACPHCHRLHEQTLAQLEGEDVFALGEITVHVRTTEPEIQFIDGQPTEIPFQGKLP